MYISTRYSNTHYNWFTDPFKQATTTNVQHIFLAKNNHHKQTLHINSTRYLHHFTTVNPPKNHQITVAGAGRQRRPTTAWFCWRQAKSRNRWRRARTRPTTNRSWSCPTRKSWPDSTRERRHHRCCRYWPTTCCRNGLREDLWGWPVDGRG